MENKQLTVVSRLKARDVMGDQLKELLLRIVEPSRAVPTNINCHVHQSREDSSLFLIYENWTSHEALDDYHELPFMQEAFGKVPDLLAGPFNVIYQDMISKEW